MVSEVLKHSASALEMPALARADGQTPQWLIAPDRVAYPHALDTMKARAKAIAEGAAGEAVWLVEHPPLYTAGTSARPADLKAPERFPVYAAGRGGQYTYHGPGQRVVYLMLDLRARGRDVHALVSSLEAWIIETLSCFNIFGETRPGRHGVWVPKPHMGPAEAKIAAVGIRVSRWVSFHGIALNVAPDLSHYQGIVPCGIADHGVTSFEDLGHIVSMEEVDTTLRRTFAHHFGPVGLPQAASGLTVDSNHGRNQQGDGA